MGKVLYIGESGFCLLVVNFYCLGLPNVSTDSHIPHFGNTLGRIGCSRGVRRTAAGVPSWQFCIKNPLTVLSGPVRIENLARKYYEALTCDRRSQLSIRFH